MKLSTKNIVVLALMLIAAGLAVALRPHISLADELAPIELEKIVGHSFGDWHEDLNVQAQVINPEQKQLLGEIYSQTLSRTYTNSQGYRIMLSIAYGKNQSDALQLHVPEVCYPSQGFALLEQRGTALILLGKPIAAKQLVTKLGMRTEPITYWTMVGDQVVRGRTNKKLAEIRYAMNNRIPDGMLVRVSSIDADTSNAFHEQNRFADALVASLASQIRPRFTGRLDGAFP